jgi:hypothetical protein
MSLASVPVGFGGFTSETSCPETEIETETLVLSGKV